MKDAHRLMLQLIGARILSFEVNAIETQGRALSGIPELASGH